MIVGRSNRGGRRPARDGSAVVLRNGSAATWRDEPVTRWHPNRKRFLVLHDERQSNHRRSI
jgi:hypothetical protein